MVRLLLFALVAWLVSAAGASACRRPIAGPEEIMARDFVTVATARVLSVEAADPSRPNRAFVASLQITDTVEGFAQTGRLTLHHREVTECPRRLPLPQVGEEWVVYLEWEAGDGGPVYYAWPKSWAERLDVRFGGSSQADAEMPRVALHDQ